MLSTRDLLKIAVARRRDAEALLAARRYDGAVYVCGYAVECALKARIVKAQGMLGFPESKAEFKPYQRLKTHDVEDLLAQTDRQA